MANSLCRFYGIGGAVPCIYCRCPAAAHTIIMVRSLYLAAVVTIFLLLLSSFFLTYSERSEIAGLKYAATRMLWSTDKVWAEPSQDRAYTNQFNKKTKLWNQNGRWSNYSPSPYRKLIEEKLTWTLKRKSNQYIKKWLKIPMHRRKIWSRNWKK